MNIKGLIATRIKDEEDEYRPKVISEEAQICLNCPLPECIGDCSWFKKEKAKLRGVKNGNKK